MQHASPPLMWRDVAAMRILCVVETPRGVDAALEAGLCATALRLASKGAPVPVAVAQIGDPALLNPRTVTLVVHAAIGAKLGAVSVRPFRRLEEGEMLFGAAPRPFEAQNTASRDAALALAISETLPWQARRDGARPIPRQ